MCFFCKPHILHIGRSRYEVTRLENEFNDDEAPVLLAFGLRICPGRLASLTQASVYFSVSGWISAGLQHHGFQLPELADALQPARLRVPIRGWRMKKSFMERLEGNWRFWVSKLGTSGLRQWKYEVDKEAFPALPGCLYSR